MLPRYRCWFSNPPCRRSWRPVKPLKWNGMRKVLDTPTTGGQFLWEQTGTRFVWHVDVEPKIMGFSPKSSMFNRGFPLWNPFCDTPIFGNTHVSGTKKHPTYIAILHFFFKSHPVRSWWIHHLREGAFLEWRFHVTSTSLLSKMILLSTWSFRNQKYHETPRSMTHHTTRWLDFERRICEFCPFDLSFRSVWKPKGGCDD